MDLVVALLYLLLVTFSIIFTIWLCRFLIEVPKTLARIAEVLERKDNREVMDRNRAAQQYLERQNAARQPVTIQNTAPQTTTQDVTKQ